MTFGTHTLRALPESPDFFLLTQLQYLNEVQVFVDGAEHSTQNNSYPSPDRTAVPGRNVHVLRPEPHYDRLLNTERFVSRAKLSQRLHAFGLSAKPTTATTALSASRCPTKPSTPQRLFFSPRSFLRAPWLATAAGQAARAQIYTQNKTPKAHNLQKQKQKNTQARECVHCPRPQ